MIYSDHHFLYFLAAIYGVSLETHAFDLETMTFVRLLSG